MRLAADDVPAVGKLLARQRTHFGNLIRNASEPAEPLQVPLVRDGDWSKAAKIDGFLKIVRNMMRSRQRSARGTKVLVCHDMKNLKVKFVCEDPAPDKLEPKEACGEAAGKFPGGDHVELAVTTKKDGYHFGVDCRGNRADIKNGDIGLDAKWTAETKVTDSGYEVVVSIDLESIGVEITKENRLGICFARMSLPRTPDERREFSSWKGDHPQPMQPVGSIFICME